MKTNSSIPAKISNGDCRGESRRNKVLSEFMRWDREESAVRLQQLLRESKDEGIFCRSVCAKGIAALAYQSLKTYQPSTPLEKKAFQQLKISYLAISARNSYYKEKLDQLLAAFMRDNIPVIPLKGLILSQRLYDDLVSRDESADFDLLAREEDKEKARALLEAEGYVFYDPGEPEEWQWYYLFRKAGSKMIELHWDITMMGRSQERIEGLWQGAELVGQGELKYYDFRPEELLLYLSAHLVNSDSLRTLRCVCDIQRLLEKYAGQIAWDSLIRKAGEWKLKGSLYTALMLNKELFGSKFPPSLLRQIGVSLPKRIFIRFFANKNVILKKGLRRAFLDKFLAYIFFEITEARCLKDYLIILKRVVFPPRQAMGQRSYILRIFKGIAKLLAPKPA